MLPLNAVFIQGVVNNISALHSRVEILLEYEDPSSRRWGFFLVNGPSAWRNVISEGDHLLFVGSLQFDGGYDFIHATAFLRLADDPDAAFAAVYGPLASSTFGLEHNDKQCL